MKLSLFMMPLHQKEKPYPQQLAEDAEAFIYADQLGYAEAWCGEHFSTSTELITSPLLFFASLIARTRQSKFATGVACLPQYHPAIYAGEAMNEDELSPRSTGLRHLRPRRALTLRPPRGGRRRGGVPDLGRGELHHRRDPERLRREALSELAG